MLEAHCLKRFYRCLVWKWRGLNKIVIWVERGSRDLSEGSWNDLKNKSHLPHKKLKTRDVCGLQSSELVARQSRKQSWKGPLKQTCFREKLLVVMKVRDTCETLCVIFRKTQFLPKTISREEVSHELLTRQSRKVLYKKMWLLKSLKPILREAISRELLVKIPLN